MEKALSIREITDVHKNKNFTFCELKDGTKLKYDHRGLSSDSSVSITLADQQVIYSGSVIMAPALYKRIIVRMQQVNTGHGGRRSGAGRKPEAVDGEGKTERKHQSMYCTDREIQFLREVLKQKRAGQNDMTLFQILEKTVHCGSCSENIELL